MAPEVAEFLARCRRDPAALTPLRCLFREFNASLGPRAGHWSRSNFVLELGRAGFQLGEFSNADCVTGLAPPTGGWSVRNGRLAFVGDA